jgi:amidase
MRFRRTRLSSASFAISGYPPEQQQQFREFFGANAPGLAPFVDWQKRNLGRLAFRAQWQRHFDDVDVFLSPVGYCEAFAHDHSAPQVRRVIDTSTGPRPYMDLMKWIAPASLTGCPATVAPIGHTPAGMPVGIQVMGPYWEDATPITFARLLAQHVGGFTAPTGYA